VELVFNKPVQLDHFFYKVAESAAARRDKTYYVRTYEEGRLVLDLELEPYQSFWKKMTFPRTKTTIDRIVFS